MAEIDPIMGTCRIRGDETDWEWLTIQRRGTIAGGFQLSATEYTWLAPIVEEAIGIELEKPLCMLMASAAQAFKEAQAD